MKILVVGGGGREHALCKILKNSSETKKVYCAPGNAGIAKDAECVNISVSELTKLAEFASINQIDLTVVGPEAPLCEGIVDIFQERKLTIFGPAKHAALLEGSKSFAKNFMNKYNIPTAQAMTFSSTEPALAYIATQFCKGVKGLVVKADGLAAGKGVAVTFSQKDAEAAVKECFSGKFGTAGQTVLIEELLIGEEASILALTDGKTIVPLVTSQDHKRLADGDKGPNTGGMGAYSPAPCVGCKLFREIEEKILNNFLIGIQSEKLDYKGIIYAGIMITDEGPKVLEFNVRFGDPETQAVLLRLNSSLADALMKTAQGELSSVRLEWNDNPAVCVVMASEGYPGKYEKGKVITGIDEAEKTGATVFHAGTAYKNNDIVTNGGRVLGVTALGKNIKDAIDNAYKAVEKIHWDGVIYRKDIAYRALRRDK